MVHSWPPLNAYDALMAGDPEVLKALDLPKDRPVVTICNAGKVGRIAAERLHDRGFEAISLAGGAKVWSLAWNTAETKLEKATVLQVRRTDKGCLSYIIGSASEAVVIDASVDPAVYLRLAKERNWTIRHVVDTHVHADHLSRSRALAEAAGATRTLPAQSRVAFTFTRVEDGKTVDFGYSRITVISAPGHTMERECYYLDTQALFTGDTLFISGVGRPDLQASPEEARERAKVLYHSLLKVLQLPADTLVFPGHASEPPAFDLTPKRNGWARSPTGHYRAGSVAIRRSTSSGLI